MNKRLLKFYREYLEEMDDWKGGYVPEEVVHAIHRLYDGLDDENQKTVIGLLLTDIRHCYTHPQIGKMDIEARYKYYEELSKLKIWLLKIIVVSVAALFVIGLGFVMQAFVISLDHDIYAIGNAIKDMFKSIF